MAKVKIVSVLDALDSQMRRALEDTIKELYPKERVNGHDALRVFKRMVSRKCSAWEEVSDDFVEQN